MAIINSAGVGKAAKSQGNLTYKYVRGRTIASSRIIENKSNTPRQIIARQEFAAMSGFVVRQASYIDAAFDKSKYGSSRNSFMTLNKTMLPEMAYFKSYIAGETSFFELMGVWFGTDLKPMAWVTYGSAAAFVSGIKNSSRQDYSSVNISFGAGVPLSDLTFGCYVSSASNTSFIPPKDFEAAGGSGISLTFSGLTITLQYADETNTLLSGLTISAGGPTESYFIPVIQVRGKNVKLDAPLHTEGV